MLMIHQEITDGRKIMNYIFSRLLPLHQAAPSPRKINNTVAEKVVVLGFYVPPTAKVIWRRVLGVKS